MSTDNKWECLALINRLLRQTVMPIPDAGPGVDKRKLYQAALSILAELHFNEDIIA